MVNGTTTRSPTFSFLFSAPTSTTSPIVSWPRISPLFICGITPSKMCRSEPQIAQAVTLMIASRGCSILGSGTESQRISPLPCHASAFIGCSGMSCEPNRMRRFSFPGNAEREAVMWDYRRCTIVAAAAPLHRDRPEGRRGPLNQIAGPLGDAVLCIVDAVEMQVIGVKSRHLLQALVIQNGEELAVKMDELLFAQPPQHAVDVHRRQAAGVG